LVFSLRNWAPPRPCDTSRFPVNTMETTLTKRVIKLGQPDVFLSGYCGFTQICVVLFYSNKQYGHRRVNTQRGYPEIYARSRSGRSCGRVAAEITWGRAAG